jgi:hypothetical protein
MRPFGDYALAYKAAGWAPIPILGGGKGVTPGGVTGHDGIDLEGARLKAAIKRYGKCVIATRAPVGVVGIDVDQYGDKTGGDTLAEWEELYGPLPATYVSTSRDDGISGIRWFRVPADWRGKANHPSVELVQRWHRQGRASAEPPRDPARAVSVDRPGPAQAPADVPRRYDRAVRARGQGPAQAPEVLPGGPGR